MAKLRSFSAYRSVERPNTRKSKYRKKSFVRGIPNCRVVKFNTGNLSKEYKYRLDLVSKEPLQVRDNALESARLTCNRTLERALGKKGFRLQVRVYPHHILREHALATGAGADRFSSGMAHAFGKPIGNAAQLDKDQIVLSIFVDTDEQIAVARQAYRKANTKLPFQKQSRS